MAWEERKFIEQMTFTWIGGFDSIFLRKHFFNERKIGIFAKSLAHNAWYATLSGTKKQQNKPEKLLGRLIGQFFRHWSPHFIDGIWAKNGKNYLAIWSHCLWSKVIGKCVHLVIVSSCKSRRFWSVSRPNCLAAELSYWVSFILRKSVWQQFGRDSLKHSIKVEHLKNCRFIATPRFFEALIWKRKRVWIFVELSVIF